MNTQKVATNILEGIGGKAKRDDHGQSTDHARWMLKGIADGYIQHEKAHRWLGYAQGILVASDLVQLSDMKAANKNCG